MGERSEEDEGGAVGVDGRTKVCVLRDRRVPGEYALHFVGVVALMREESVARSAHVRSLSDRRRPSLVLALTVVC